MGIIMEILNDYENLIKTRITMPLDNGDIIKFLFNPQDLPHLLGLQHLIDIPVLFEYKNDRISASDLYRGMKNGIIDTEKFEESVYFEEVYNSRIKYFSSKMLIDIIKARQLIQFNPIKIKDFFSKLDKVKYMFWKLIKDENNTYGYFGIGFTASGNGTDINYPNTFFYRADNQYIYNQVSVLPLSLMMKDKKKEVCFEIYWDDIRQSMKKNTHYKWLLSHSEIDIENFEKSEKMLIDQSDEVCKHYKLMRMDEMNKAYLPYMTDDFRWSNAEKNYILERSKKDGKEYIPNEIIMLLNEFRQMKLH